MTDIFVPQMSPSVQLRCLVVIHIKMVVFFFSSRRRHTRYIGDWSSEVCSSDLRLPHHNERVDVVDRRRVRERLRVVAGGDRDYAARLLLVAQRRKLVEDAARLERPGALEELRLE